MKLVIVEDEVILAMALAMMLEEWGHQVVGTADSEAGALARVQSGRPDAVVMDIRLGRRECGLRAAKRIRKSDDLPIIFCTAYADNPAIQTEIRGIENAYLVGKPIDEDQLRSLLLRVAERRRYAARPPISAGGHQPINYLAADA